MCNLQNLLHKTLIQSLKIQNLVCNYSQTRIQSVAAECRIHSADCIQHTEYGRILFADKIQQNTADRLQLVETCRQITVYVDIYLLICDFFCNWRHLEIQEHGQNCTHVGECCKMQIF